MQDNTFVFFFPNIFTYLYVTFLTNAVEESLRYSGVFQKFLKKVFSWNLIQNFGDHYYPFWGTKKNIVLCYTESKGAFIYIANIWTAGVYVMYL